MNLPSIEGPVTGGNGPFVGGVAAGLAEHDYTQTEYFLAGTADAYEVTGDGATKTVDSADYRTRILVYRPADAARFNGTVVVEWLNVSGGVDGSPDWTFLHREMMRSGYAWVGVSAQSVGVHGGQSLVATANAMGLTEVDPERYGPLAHPGDVFSFDIYTQAGAVARGVPGTALAELPVERVIAIGESQSAMRLTAYVNVVDAIAQEYDGFFVHARGRSGSPLDASGPMRDPSAPPEPFREGLRVPVLCFEAETDLIGLGYYPARQPDNDKFRLWEVAGTSHADVYTFIAGFVDSGALPITELAALWAPTTSPMGFELDQPINTGPQHYVLQAALAHFDRWLRDGTAPPSAPRLEVQPGEPATSFVVDEHGIARGGIRTPHVDVPIATLSGLGNGGAAISFLCGTTIPFSAEKLASLYTSKRDYCAKFDAATDAAVAAGFFLEADAPEIKAIAAELYRG
ncbi:MAG: alpha/beta hydrolase domain-containing protein [Acidimicrobiia bacterium]